MGFEGGWLCCLKITEHVLGGPQLLYYSLLKCLHPLRPQVVLVLVVPLASRKKNLQMSTRSRPSRKEDAGHAEMLCLLDRSASDLLPDEKIDSRAAEIGPNPQHLLIAATRILVSILNPSQMPRI